MAYARFIASDVPKLSGPPAGDMIRDRTIVCVASSWDYDPTSKHHLMKALSRENRIVWVNYHGTRRPHANATDARAAWSVLRRAARGVTHVHDRFVQVTPLVLPGVTNRHLERLHERMLTFQIRRAIRVFHEPSASPLQIWTFAPDVPFLKGAFGEECFLYYCVDEHRLFEGVNRAKIDRLERRTLAEADLVITTSQALLESKRRARSDAVLVRHGVDYEHFASAWRDRPAPPEDLAHVPQPIFGFFGLIHHWIDVALLAKVADMCPAYSFVLIGESKIDLSALRGKSNVYLLGRRPYHTLPRYCAAFEAGLLPFAMSEMAPHINPIKMHEYLAAGLPIISTPLPEARTFEGAITIADDAAGFAAACEEIIRNRYPQRREVISRLVEHDSWEARTRRISALVVNRTTSRVRTANRMHIIPEHSAPPCYDRAPRKRVTVSVADSSSPI